VVVLDKAVVQVVQLAPHKYLTQPQPQAEQELVVVQAVKVAEVPQEQEVPTQERQAVLAVLA